MATASKIVGLILVFAVGQYYLTTFLIWFGHWFAHIKKGPLTFIHVGGHHALYPDSRHYFSPRFRYASLKNDSAVAQIPWQIVAAIGQFLLLPDRLWLLCLAEAVLLNVLFNYVHTQFHLEKSKLEKWCWFVRARNTHKWHHDLDVDYMVLDHFWDKALGTYCDKEPSTSR